MERPVDPGVRRERAGGAIRPAEIVLALSLATDFGRAQPLGTGLRSCLLAVRLGEHVGLSDQDLTDAYYLALLRFAGCTATAHLAALAFGDDLAFRSRVITRDHTHPLVMMRFILGYVGADQPLVGRARALVGTLPLILREAGQVNAAECEVAQGLAGRLGMGEGVRGALGQAFERWDGKGTPGHLKGEAIALAMRVVQLAQDMELFHRIGGVEAAIAVARERAAGAYDPALVERFCRKAAPLCGSLESEVTWDAALAAEPAPQPALGAALLEEGARAIADFADLTSPYTVGHSRGVGALAAEAARCCGLPEAEQDALRRAGYLHDLGRVGVSAAIWAKPGPLSEGEWEQVRLHPYYTERVLARSRALAALGALAALHHERLDGSGYHRALPAAAQPPAARLLAAADCYRAMIEPRPHRPALPPEGAATHLRGAVRAGTLDGDSAQAVLAAAGHRVAPVRRDRVGGLSERELEVLALIARGASYREVARALHITPKTAEHHVGHIYTKIGVSTRAAATLFAMQHDLVRPL